LTKQALSVEKIIKKILEDDILVILNIGDPIRFNPANGIFSAIDLTDYYIHC